MTASPRSTTVLIPLFLALAAGLAAASAAAAETLWALPRFGSNLRIIDRTGGQDLATVVLSTAGPWRGIAVHPATGLMYASQTQSLYSIDQSTGTATEIGPFSGELVRDITFDDRARLWAVTGDNGPNPSSLVAVDLATGAATFAMLLDGNRAHGLAHDPLQPGILYHLADNTFETVDLATGVATDIGLDGDAVEGNAMGLVYDPFDELFRFFDDSGRYYTVSRAGIVTDLGITNPAIYFGLTFEDEDLPVIFRDGFESGDTAAWSGASP